MEKIYKVNGLSCTSCSTKFENNIKEITTVKDAKVNFGAGLVKIDGDITISQLERAGKFENLKITNYHTSTTERKPKSTLSFIKENINIIVSILFITFAMILKINNTLTSLSTLLFLFAILISGHQLFKEGFKDLLKFNFTMETLMTIAITGAVLIGEWTEGSIVVILFAISGSLETFSMDRARQSITSLMNIAPKEALIIRDGIEMSLPVENIEINDIMLVKPGIKIAMDGLVIKGTSSVNQSAITGESIPVQKTINDEVFAGTLNEEGLLEILVTKLVNDTTISKIIHLVEEAQEEKAPAQAFVDKFSKIYTPSILLLSFLIIILPPLLFNASWDVWIYQGLSLLVVGCPCSLVISTPVSIVSAITNSAKHGVLVKGGIYLEEMGQINAIAFDKTGTLTTGKPVITDLEVYDENNVNTYLAIMCALEANSQHPVASSFIQYARDTNIVFKDVIVEDFKSLTGVGIQGTVTDQTYYLGSPSLFTQYLELTIEEEKISNLQSDGKTVMVFGSTTDVLAIVAVADTIRSTSVDAIDQLHHIGIQNTTMLTGDNSKTAHAIGKQAHVTNIEGDLMPEDKLEMVKNLKTQFGSVAMVGDGVNDAPALAAANVGIAMGGAGTDTALETADVVLMGDDLSKLPFIINLSKKTIRIIKQNITFSLLIKLLAIILIIPGWLTLWIAIVADMGATLIVTFNGMRLMNIK